MNRSSWASAAGRSLRARPGSRGGDHHERVRQRSGDALGGHLPLPPWPRAGRSGSWGRPVDLVGQEQVGEDRAPPEPHPLHGPPIEDELAGDVGGMRSGVNWTLPELEVEGSGQGLDQRVLATPGTPSSSTCPRTRRAAIRPDSVPPGRRPPLPISSHSATIGTRGSGYGGGGDAGCRYPLGVGGRGVVTWVGHGSRDLLTDVGQRRRQTHQRLGGRDGAVTEYRGDGVDGPAGPGRHDPTTVSAAHRAGRQPRARSRRASAPQHVRGALRAPLLQTHQVADGDDQLNPAISTGILSTTTGPSRPGKRHHAWEGTRPPAATSASFTPVGRSSVAGPVGATPRSATAPTKVTGRCPPVAPPQSVGAASSATAVVEGSPPSSRYRLQLGRSPTGTARARVMSVRPVVLPSRTLGAADVAVAALCLRSGVPSLRRVRRNGVDRSESVEATDVAGPDGSARQSVGEHPAGPPGTRHRLPRFGFIGIPGSSSPDRRGAEHHGRTRLGDSRGGPVLDRGEQVGVRHHHDRPGRAPVRAEANRRVELTSRTPIAAGEPGRGSRPAPTARVERHGRPPWRGDDQRGHDHGGTARRSSDRSAARHHHRFRRRHAPPVHADRSGQGPARPLSEAGVALRVGRDVRYQASSNRRQQVS